MNPNRKSLVNQGFFRVFEAGVNSLLGAGEFDAKEIVKDIATDAITATFIPDVFPSEDIPTYIRHIKADAVERGIKGTKKLVKYLNYRQVKAVITNTINSAANDYLDEKGGTFLKKQLIIASSCAD